MCEPPALLVARNFAGSHSHVTLAVTLLLLYSLHSCLQFSDCWQAIEEIRISSVKLLLWSSGASRRTVFLMGCSRTADLVFCLTLLTSSSPLFNFTSRMGPRCHKFSTTSTMSPVSKKHLYLCSDCLLTYSNNY